MCNNLEVGHNCCCSGVKCKDNAQLEITEDDLLDVKMSSLFNKKYDKFTNGLYFLWGTCFGVLISIVMVCLI